MKKISLKTFLILVYSFLLFIFIVIAIIVFANMNTANKARNYAIDYTNLYIIWSNVQNSQHEFLINYSDDAVFFQTEQNKNLRKSQISYSDYIKKIDSLKQNNFILNNKLSDQLETAKDNVTKVEEVFEQLSHSLFLRGSQKTGVIGDCFAYNNLAYSYTSDSRLKIYLEKMNDYFLQYLNSPNQILYQNYLSVYTQMNAYILNSNFNIDTTQIIDTTLLLTKNSNLSDEFVNSANSFKKSFSKLISIDRRIFLNNQANLTTQWSDLNISISSEFSKGIIDANKLKDSYIKRAQFIIVISITLIILFFLILSLTLPFVLSSRIKELQNLIEPLKKGEIPEYDLKKLKVNAFTELIDISDNIKDIITSLKSASVFAVEIGKSNFEFDYKPIGASDELGNALILLRNNLKKAQVDESVRRKEDDIRQWSNIGIAKFSEILRQATKDISELSNIIIKDLVNYLEANQGGIFIINENRDEEIKLELVASYAYSKERKKRREFFLGEGLIGTCAVEKATIYMTDIPEDYISITSGLGAANPRSLLIVPLKFEENILGVLEIASFNIIEKYQIEFVEKIAESIASAVSISKINERTARLLELSNVESEQRALKEEELRQNLEELQATQERAAQRELELNSLIELVNKVAFIIELDIDGNVISVPDRIIDTFGLERNEIVGRHFSEFDFNPNSELAKNDFWQELLEGKEKIYQHKYVSETNTFWLNDYIVPSLDFSGNVQKFVCVIFDNTEQINNQKELQVYTDELKLKEQEVVQKVKELERAKNQADELLLELQGTFQGIDNTVLRAEYSPEGIFIDANRLHTEVLGYNKEDMLGKSILEFIGESEKDEFSAFWKQVAAGNSKELTVKRLNKSTGKDIWLVNQYNPIFDKNKRVVKILYLAIDITKQKQTDEQTENLLIQSENQSLQLKSLFEFSSDAIQVIKNGKFSDCNSATLEMFGFETKEEFIKITPSDISPKKQPNGENSTDKSNEYIYLAIKEGFEQFEWTHLKKDGTEFQAIVTLIAYKINEDQFIYSMVKKI